MKKHSLFLLLALSIVTTLTATLSCSTDTKQENNLAQIADLERKYQDSLSILRAQLVQANDQIELLKYPADQRLRKAHNLVDAGELDNALEEIKQLKKLFPNSTEVTAAEALIIRINEIKEKQRQEEERIKALGYKAFKDNPSVNIGDVTYAFSGFTYGRTFTFDYVQDISEYYYQVADKNCTYILANLTISTKENYASEPHVYACKIENGKLKKIDDFRIEYASYNTYGAKIGNYSETSHDFSKVNSVKYKMAAQIPQSYTNIPIVIIVKKTSGYMSDELSLDDIKKDYEVVKILNRNRM